MDNQQNLSEVQALEYWASLGSIQSSLSNLLSNSLSIPKTSLNINHSMRTNLSHQSQNWEKIFKKESVNRWLRYVEKINLSHANSVEEYDSLGALNPFKLVFGVFIKLLRRGEQEPGPINFNEELERMDESGTIMEELDKPSVFETQSSDIMQQVMCSIYRHKEEYYKSLNQFEKKQFLSKFKIDVSEQAKKNNNIKKPTLKILRTHTQTSKQRYQSQQNMKKLRRCFSIKEVVLEEKWEMTATLVDSLLPDKSKTNSQQLLAQLFTFFREVNREQSISNDLHSILKEYFSRILSEMKHWKVQYDEDRQFSKIHHNFEILQRLINDETICQ